MSASYESRRRIQKLAIQKWIADNRHRLVKANGAPVDDDQIFLAAGLDREGVATWLGLDPDAKGPEIIEKMKEVLNVIGPTFGRDPDPDFVAPDDSDPAAAGVVMADEAAKRNGPPGGKKPGRTMSISIPIDEMGGRVVLSKRELEACHETGAKPEVYARNKAALAKRRGSKGAN